MDLMTWKTNNELSISQVAGRAEVSRETVRRALDGLPLRIKTAEKLSALTGGEVSLASLLVGTKAAA